MKLSEFCVNRPVTTIMTIASIVVLGLIGLTRLPLNENPDVQMNFLSVNATYTSSSPEEVEREITIPLEDVLSTTSYLETMESQSRTNGANVSMRFADGVDIDMAALEVRDKLDQVRGDLPDELRRLYIFRFDPNAFPVLMVRVAWDGSQSELHHIVEDVLIRKLMRIDGVAEVDARGMDVPQVLVDMDQDALQAYRVDVRNLAGIIRTNNTNTSGGNIYSAGRKYSVRSIGEYQSVEEIANTPVRGATIRLNDLANVRMGFPEKKAASRLNGKESVTLRITKASNANTVEVVQNVKAALAEIEANPNYDKLGLLVFRDDSVTILNSLTALYQSGLLGAILATIVLFLFLRKLRSTLIIQMAIPISVVTAFLIMYLLRVFGGSNISINLISLSALMVSVGMLLDNSVVVLENIFRHKQEENCDAKEAAIKGAGEVTMPVIAATSTTLVVFLPMFFMRGGGGGRGPGAFSSSSTDFPVVVCVALIASLVVALTLVPLLASKVFTGRERATRQGIVRLRSLYRNFLDHALRWRYAVGMVALALPFLAMYLFGQIERELEPYAEDREIEYRITFPTSFTLEQMTAVFDNLESRYMARQDELEIKNITSYYRLPTDLSGQRGSRARSNELSIYLKEAHEGGITDVAVLKDSIQAMLPVIPGVNILESQGRGFGRRRGGVSIDLKGPSTEVLSYYADKLSERLETLDIVRDVSSSIESSDREIVLNVDRERASKYGLNSAQVARTLTDALGTRATSFFKTSDGEVDIALQLADDERVTTDDLGNIVFQNNVGELVSLNTISELSMQPASLSIAREERRTLVKVMARMAPGTGMVQANDLVKLQMAGFTLPGGYSWSLGQNFADLQSMDSEITWIIFFAVVLIYIIMASLFESFIHPLTILFCLPSALVGVALAYKFTNTTLNTQSINGVLILIGIVVNNGIILIDYVNQLRENGMNRWDAILNGGQTRLRPIIMTALTTILGLSPMVAAKFFPSIFQAAQGSISTYAPIGIAVVGGLALSTFLTLLIIPCVYYIMDDFSIWMGKVFRALVHRG
jgi:hydrophobic/amphiphilic exporter-1 (mainly G- bacteria), HAE1 family